MRLLSRVSLMLVHGRVKFEGYQKIKSVVGCLALPEGSAFISVEHFGTSAWTVTGRVAAQNPDGTQSDYFLKASSQMSQT